MPNEPLTPEVLRLLYSTAIEEYRFEVQLGWDRLKFFTGLSVTLLAALATFGRGAYAPLLCAAHFAGVCISVLGSFAVLRTHRYYRAARAHFQRIEQALGATAAGLALSTTPGMADTGGPRLRVVTVSVLVLQVLGMLHAFAAVAWVIR